MTSDLGEKERRDSSILNRLQENPKDETAWRQFIESTSPLLLRYLARLTRDTDAARDLYQDVLVRFVEKRMFSEVKNADAAVALLLTMARNRFIDWLRRAHASRTVSLQEDLVPSAPDGLSSGETAATRASEMKQLTSHLSEPEQQLLAFALRGESLATIAKTLGVSYSSAAVRMFRLREKLRHLSDNDADILKM